MSSQLSDCRTSQKLGIRFNWHWLRAIYLVGFDAPTLSHNQHTADDVNPNQMSFHAAIVIIGDLARVSQGLCCLLGIGELVLCLQYELCTCKKLCTKNMGEMDWEHIKINLGLSFVLHISRMVITKNASIADTAQLLKSTRICSAVLLLIFS